MGLVMGLMSWFASVMMRYELALTTTRLWCAACREFYAGAVTFHALTMIFFLIMPALWGGFGNYLMPLKVGTSEVAYPRWNNHALYVLLVSAGMILAMVGAEWVLGTGWTLYAPLSCSSSGASAYSVDWLVASLATNGVSSTMSSVNFVGTLLLNRIVGWGMLQDVYVVAIVVTSILLLAFLPVLTSSLAMLETDRHMGTVMFDGYEGGDALMYEHGFWTFAHPEVYILIVPAFGIVSALFMMWHLFCAPGMVAGVIAIGFVGAVVGGHHMYGGGIESDTVVYFSSATMLVAIPTATKVFHWASSIVMTKNA